MSACLPACLPVCLMGWLVAGWPCDYLDVCLAICLLPLASLCVVSMRSVNLQIAHPRFLRRTLPALEGAQVRLAHTRPAYQNVSLHGDVFSQVSALPLPALQLSWPAVLPSLMLLHSVSFSKDKTGEEQEEEEEETCFNTQQRFLEPASKP